MIVAELEVCHSHGIAPTRRVALGVQNLPIAPSPGAGGLLLAGIVANNASRVVPELREDLFRLIERLAEGQRVVQPQVRHRFQTDRVGLLSSVHRLVANHGGLDFQFQDESGWPVQHALAAVYAAASLPEECRAGVFEAINLALLWVGEVDRRFMSQMMNGRQASLTGLTSWSTPFAWALELLGIEWDGEKIPDRRLIQQRFRRLVREAHPDHGGLSAEAATRIADLTEARRILLGARRSGVRDGQ